MTEYAKRLIEIDLPIKRISAHARREKSIRHGHISTMHIWWARRPLAACRAVICASLWPDPADPMCPESFRQIARNWMSKWATEYLAKLSEDSFPRFIALQKAPERLKDGLELRGALLDFIADFANWDNSTLREYTDTSSALTQAAHEALGGAAGTRPLVVDPFAGGGSIPLEALRVGADAFASDLNPIPVLLNKVVLEYIPKHGKSLSAEVRRLGEVIKKDALESLSPLYPADADGKIPLAYLWSRTVTCEGPGCGAEVPIITKTILAHRKNTNIVIRCDTDKKRKLVTVVVDEQPKTAPVPDGTVRRSSVTCPICAYTTPAANVRKQFVTRHGGTTDARLLAVVLSQGEGSTKTYRSAKPSDLEAVAQAQKRLKSQSASGAETSVPSEPLPYLRSIFNINLLGVTEWGQLLTPRQAVLLTTFAQLIKDNSKKQTNSDLALAAATCMGLALDKMADFHTSLTRWIYLGEKIGNTFGRQALGIIWDYAEANPFADMSGSWDRCIDYLAKVVDHIATINHTGHVEQASATQQALPDQCAAAFVTDPPYYDLVPYADLSDFFYVWLKRSVGHLHSPLFDEQLSPKQQEIVQLAERNRAYAYKTRENFEHLMSLAMAESRRVLNPNGVGVVFFAHKGTAAWETQLQAMINAGWTIVGSWPLATEREGRLRAMDSAVLASSIQLVCRPRQFATAGAESIGDWRDVLQELPRRIHDWMPRLDAEGVVGADAIFACLGPALEIFSRYSRVEKASGDAVTLREYLEHVWAAVAKEALTMIFTGADTTAFEEDARVTAMWLWTMNAGLSGNGESDDDDDGNDETDADTEKTNGTGFALEYDAARKIAQGLGARLEDLRSLVEVNGETARLLPVAERAAHLFAKSDVVNSPVKKKKVPQLDMFKTLEQTEGSEPIFTDPELARPGNTVLDRIHQSMILFAAGRSDALKRFLVDEGVGRDARFWSLAQSLSALYPTIVTEKRWIDGVLARKKGLGF
ncbi:MAG TPA: DUF1156 domain-containing protein [Rhizomicrobium sp.]|nr:DUF1156 domain-containing protein [Rhizomicrobium sp.]